MIDNNSVNQSLYFYSNFKNIFTNYEDGYKVIQSIYSNRNGHGMLGYYVHTFCWGFIRKIKETNGGIINGFLTPCMQIGRYLYYIQILDDLIDKIPNCIFFCYKLRNELVKYFDDTKVIEDLYKNYEDFPDNKPKDFETFIQVCPKFADYPDNFEKYMNFLINCKYVENSNFKNMLEDIKNSYYEKCPKDIINLVTSVMVTETRDISDKSTIENRNNIGGTNTKGVPNEETTALRMKLPVTDTMTETIT
ncbi:variable surface protein, partial [Plasmodium gonderi]